MKKQNLLELFDDVIISGEVGVQKPDPEIFMLACKRLTISPTELIFVDDSANSLKSSKTVGYAPLLYISNEQLEDDLQKLLPNFS